MSVIHVLQSGKKTCISYRVENGVLSGTVLRRGSGIFIDRSFDSPESAEAACHEMLAENPHAVFYVIDGDRVIQSVMDLGTQQTLTRQRERRFVIITTALVLIASLIVDLLFAPLLPFGALIAIPFGFVALYLALLCSFNAHSLDAPAAMLILIILFVLSLLRLLA